MLLRKPQNLLQVTDVPLVSSDFGGNKHSSIVDAELTMIVEKRMVKVWPGTTMSGATATDSSNLLALSPTNWQSKSSPRIFCEHLLLREAGVFYRVVHEFLAEKDPRFISRSLEAEVLE